MSAKGSVATFDSDASPDDWTWAVEKAVHHEGWLLTKLDHDVWQRAFPDRYKMCCARLDGGLLFPSIHNNFV